MSGMVGSVNSGISNYHHQMKVRTLPTVRVTLKGSGSEVVINESDFDPKLHELVEEKAAKQAAKPEHEEVDPDGEPSTPPALDRESLEGLSIAELKQLPQWEAVRGKHRLTTKDKMVEALLELGAE